MSRQEYIAAIIALYRVANSSDSETAPAWISPAACADHCRAFELILTDVAANYPEYRAIMDSI